MEANEIIECYNTLSDYAKSRVATLVKDLHSAQEESRSYCIKVCPKCGAVEPVFTKGGITHGEVTDMLTTDLFDYSIS